MRIVDCIKRNGPTILSITAMVGVVGTAISAAWAANKAAEKKGQVLKLDTVYIDNEAKEVPVVEPAKLGYKEYIKRYWKFYIPTVGCAIVTCSCIGLSDHLNKKRQAALISACLATTKMFNDYREAVKEKYGEESDAAIRSEVIERQIKEDDIYIPTATDDEVYLFYDELSGEYFNATMEKVIMMDGLECYILGVKDWMG